MKHNHYVRLSIMTVLCFLSMYILMYAMVDRWENVLPNWNQFYMAGLMTAPMVIIELLLMGKMYGQKKLNLVIMGVATLSGVAFFLLIRMQTGITDQQFLKSMIPHHAGALLMCEQAELKDAEIKELCETIISGQQAEIDLMKAKLSKIK